MVYHLRTRYAGGLTEPTVCREWAQDSIRRAIHEALTEAARVVRNKNTSAFDEAADEIERLRDA